MYCREMLQMGSSEQWGQALLKLTRGTTGETTKLNAGALLSYFAPLQVILLFIHIRYCTVDNAMYL